MLLIVSVYAGSIIVHVFSSEAREMYDLDGLWSKGNNCTKVTSGQANSHSIGETPDTASSYA